MKSIYLRELRRNEGTDVRHLAEHLLNDNCSVHMRAVSGGRKRSDTQLFVTVNTSKEHLKPGMALCEVLDIGCLKELALKEPGHTCKENKDYGKLGDK